MKIGPSLKKSLWWDSLLSFALFAILGICAFSTVPITENMENRTYDFRLKLRQWFGSADSTFSDQILLVEIDNESIAAEGRWPWARGKIGDLLRRISLGEPRVIGVSILYTEPDNNQGLEFVRELKKKYDEILLTQKEEWGSIFTKVSRDKKIPETRQKAPFNTGQV